MTQLPKWLWFIVLLDFAEDWMSFRFYDYNKKTNEISLVSRLGENLIIIKLKGFNYIKHSETQHKILSRCLIPNGNDFSIELRYK